MGDVIAFIGNTIINGLAYILNWFINIFPKASISDTVFTSLQNVIGYMYKFDFIFPVNTMILVLISIVSFEIFFLIFRFVKYVANNLIHLKT